MFWSLPAPPCLLLQLAFVRHLLSKLLCFLQLPLLCWDHEVAGLFHWCCEDSRTAMQLLFFTAKAKTVLSCLCTIVIVFWNWEEFHMYVSNPCFLFSLCNIDLFWILIFFYFFFFSPLFLRVMKGRGRYTAASRIPHRFQHWSNPVKHITEAVKAAAFVLISPRSVRLLHHVICKVFRAPAVPQ